MALMALYNCTASYVPASECASLLGDNSESGGLNPWDPALRVVWIIGSAKDEEERHTVTRYYTIRPARFPQDKHIVEDILLEQLTNLGTASQDSVHRIIEAYATTNRGQILLVCAILPDGGDEQQSMARRLKRAPEHVRHPTPIPLGTSAASFNGPSGNYYVRFDDLPQPVLQEYAVGLVSTKPLKTDSQAGDAALKKPSSLRSQTQDRPLFRLFPFLRGRENRCKENVELACEMERLYVKDEHHKCLAYALVDTMIATAKENDCATMILKPSSAGGLEYAKEIFEKAGPDPSNVLALPSEYKVDHGMLLKSPNPSALEIKISKDSNGKDAEVLKMILTKWPGPLDTVTAAKILRRKRQQEEEEQDNRGEFPKAKKAGRRGPSLTHVVNTGSPYKYAPLDEDAHEVRLLTLLPGPPDADIRISLGNHELYRHGFSNVLKYEALSYAWGSTDDPGQVFIGRSQRTLSVTRSLAEALLHLRNRDEPRHLWIDAICVNQADLAERGSQIKRMAEIYRNAHRVIVWLGPGTPQSTEAMKILSWVGCTVDVNWFSHTVTGHHDPLPESLNENYISGCANMNLSFAFDKTQLECLLNILSRSWFERLWIWQEIRLASEKSIVQCGFDSVSWGDFSSAIFLMAHKNFPSETQEQSKNNSLLDSRVQLAYRICDIGVEDIKSLFEMTRFSKCADPKDRVYSLLSLFDDAKIGLQVIPDYTKTVYEVYREATIRMLMDLGELNILASIELKEDEPKLREHWSTWVPDWSKPRRTSPVLYAFAAHKSRAEVSQYGRAVQMAGVAVAEICDLCAFDPAALHPLRLSDIDQAKERYEATRKNLLRITEYFSREQHFASPDIGSFCRTLVAGEDADNLREPKDAPSVSYRAMQDLMQRLLNTKLHSSPPTRPHKYEELILTHVLTYCEGRSLFRLRNGNFGFAPSAAREGDVVVIFLGCDSPLVLRPTGSQFRIIGEAYCDGIMDGEALLGPLPASERPIIQFDAGTSSFYRKALKTGEIPLEDPRLGELPPGWTRCWVGEEESLQIGYTNGEIDGGVVSRHDPRLSSFWLREQGVNVQTFEIV